jgi:3-hydroxymyristoyl/3-hydroxydecanoyl-(acyl carrier protein) dehydratase
MTLLPETLGERIDAGAVVLSLRISEDLAYLAGHFPEIPVVPGVAQIHWAVHFARQRFKMPGSFSHMEAVKFKDVLLPGQRLELTLRHVSQSGKLEFLYRSETSEYSSGRIYFHGEPI